VLGTGTTPPDAERLIQSVLAELGWDADASTVAARVRRLNVGLPREDEFSVVCAWLGRCLLLHKLDQNQLPRSSRNEFQVPDLLAFFSTQNGRSPVLIEVKARNAQTLSLKPDALDHLKNYAELLKLPLLIAWKFHSIWTLFEAKHLRKAVKNFNISHDLAMKENLLGVLAGDVAYTIGAGAGVHLRLRKDELVTHNEDSDGRTEEWKMTIDDVFFTDYNGNRRTDLDSEVESLFTAFPLEERQEHTDTHVTMSFIARSEAIQFSHTALVDLLNWGLPGEQQINWRTLLYKEQVIANIGSFSAALNAALRQKVVQYVLHLLPHSMPDFVSAPS
jgi:Holliday junction resolvase